jgi:hypothetical protein
MAQQGAHGLSLLFQTIVSEQGNGAEHLAQALSQPVAGKPPKILHYLWLIELTDKFPPIYPPDSTIEIKTFLLTTVYDENFHDYIADLVAASPELFNQAAASILGLQNLVPVQDPDNLSKFIQFVLDHDLNDGGVNPTFFGAYIQSVDAILQVFPQGS